MLLEDICFPELQVETTSDIWISKRVCFWHSSQLIKSRNDENTLDNSKMQNLEYLCKYCK